jgi:hypothetical protein
VERLETACEKVLSYTATPNFRSVRTILKTGSDRIKPDIVEIQREDNTAFAFVRGAAYYGGGENNG